MESFPDVPELICFPELSFGVTMPRFASDNRFGDADRAGRFRRRSSSGKSLSVDSASLSPARHQSQAILQQPLAALPWHSLGRLDGRDLVLLPELVILDGDGAVAQPHGGVLIGIRALLAMNATQPDDVCERLESATAAERQGLFAGPWALQHRSAWEQRARQD